MHRVTAHLNRLLIFSLLLASSLLLLLAVGGLPVSAAQEAPLAPNNSVTPVATVTGTAPTATNTRTITATRTPTQTRTATNTATPTPTPGCNDWRYVQSPTSGQQVNTLYGVSAASPNDIWAVGNKGQYSSVNLSVMLQHWDGTAWTLLPINTPGTLRGVDVISSNDVWAVGYTYDPPAQTMIMHWDGTTWTTVPSPSVPGAPNYLYAVAAAGPNDIWAVGEAADQALALHWDGTAWTIVPTTDAESGALKGVAVVGPNDVWAVGTFGNYDNYNLILHWDGTEWTEVTSPNPASYINRLEAVNVVSPTDVWAAGSSSDGNSTFSPTILHWDGTMWTESLVTLPGSPSAVRSPQLFGISAASSTEAYAVGWAWDSSVQVNIVLEWDGTTWTRSNPPRPSGYYSHLQAVTTVGAGEAWAVGVLGNASSIYVPQVLHYGPTCGTPTATVTGTPPSATPAPCGVAVGALTAGDPTLSSYLYRLFPANTCDAPQPYQGTAGAGGTYYYDTHTYPNTTGTSTCVSILLDPMTCSGTGGPFIHASAYLNTFDPTNLETNYLGDIGNSPSGPTTFSVTVPAGQSVVVVVNAVASGSNGACPGYRLTVNGHGACPSPTPGTPTATPTCVPDRWATVASIPGPRMGAAVAAVGGFLYEAGGDVSTQGIEGPAGISVKGDSPDVRTAAASRYDGTSWAPIANMPLAVMDGAGVSDGTYFYVIGGSSNTAPVANNQRYDPTSNTWTARAPLPQAASGAASVFYNGRIYVIGGCNGGSCSLRLNTVYIYDPTTNTWSTGADVPTGAAFATAEVIGSYIYLAGGLGNPGEIKAYRYDPLTNTWNDAAMADLPDSWWSAASGVLNGKMYHVGGIVNNTSGASRRTIIYDPVANTWTEGPNLVTGTFRMQGDTYNNSLYVVGGSVWASYTARVERFTINNGCSTPSVVPTNTGIVTSTSTAIASPTSCANPVITGSLTLDDPTQAGRLNTLLDASTCLDPRGCPGVLDIVPRHYDAYAFQNTSNTAACFTVDIEAACLDEILIHSSAYLGTFDPNNLCQNYLADVGPGILTNSIYSFTVPAGQTFVVVVNELAPNLLCPEYTLTVTGPACPVPSTPVPTSTSIIPTGTVVVPTVTLTLPVPPTALACAMSYSDVPRSNAFYNQIMCLSCMGFVSGYSDGTFQPNMSVTRGQLAKIVSNTAGFGTIPTEQTFEDVPPTHTFYMYIERMVARGVLSGYACGGPNEPCVTGKPYFRPGANATRGQISKVVSNAAGLTDLPVGQTFEDVPPTHTFYEWIQRLAQHDMMSGYACGGPGEPCGTTNRPYFRPASNATRGQVSKIVGNGFYPDCTMR